MCLFIYIFDLYNATKKFVPFFCNQRDINGEGIATG